MHSPNGESYSTRSQQYQQQTMVPMEPTVTYSNTMSPAMVYFVQDEKFCACCNLRTTLIILCILIILFIPSFLWVVFPWPIIVSAVAAFITGIVGFIVICDRKPRGMLAYIIVGAICVAWLIISVILVLIFNPVSDVVIVVPVAMILVETMVIIGSLVVADRYRRLLIIEGEQTSLATTSSRFRQRSVLAPSPAIAPTPVYVRTPAPVYHPEDPVYATLPKAFSELGIPRVKVTEPSNGNYRREQQNIPTDRRYYDYNDTYRTWEPNHETLTKFLKSSNDIAKEFEDDDRDRYRSTRSELGQNRIRHDNNNYRY